MFPLNWQQHIVAEGNFTVESGLVQVHEVSRGHRFRFG